MDSESIKLRSKQIDTGLYVSKLVEVPKYFLALTSNTATFYLLNARIFEIPGKVRSSFKPV